MIQIRASGYGYSSRVTQMVFPAGEVGVKLNQTVARSERVDILARIQSANDLMALMLTVDAIRAEEPTAYIHLCLPYVPYARQDRVTVAGEAVSIRVLATMINSLRCESVAIIDPHSDVAGALIDRVLITEAHTVFADCKNWDDEWIVAPDAGATKRCEKFAREVRAKGVIQCIKKRDPATGQLSGFHCLEDVTGKKLTIVDDICDAGGTFLGLRAELAAAAQVDLVVTHGLFTKGVAKVACVFNKVYTALTYHDEVPEVVANVEWMDVRVKG